MNTKFSTWGDEFFKLTPEMYELIKSYPTPVLIACSTVNPRHPLPKEHLELVENKLKKSNSIKNNALKKIIVSIVQLPIFACREICRIALIKLFFHKQLKRYYTNKQDVVIKTWCVGDIEKDKPDFYFGNLPELLADKNLSAITISGNLTKISTLDFTKQLLDSKNNILPELALVPLWAPLAIVFRQFINGFKLLIKATFSSRSNTSSVLLQTGLDCLTPSTFSHLIHFYTTKTAIKIWQPKAYVCLYEGQPWEKLAWLAVKSSNTACKIVGYQHTVIMKHALGLLSPNINSWECSAPDIVVSLGQTTINMMLEGHKTLGTTFIPMGSFRQHTNDVDITPPQPVIKTVLVVPEGVKQEACLLFNRAIEAAHLLPDYHFIFRCHPVLPFSSIKNDLDINIETIANIEVSNISLEEDFKRSSVVFYRGSSVALYAGLAGLKAYYLDELSMPYVNPFYQFSDWYEDVSGIDQMVSKLVLYAEKDINEVKCSWQKVQPLLKNYVKPIDRNEIEKFVELINE